MSKLDDILTALENAVEHDIRSRMTGMNRQLEAPKHTHWKASNQIKELMLEIIKDSTNWDEAVDGSLLSELDEDKLRQKVEEL